MKNAFSLVTAHIKVCVAGTVVCAFLYMVFYSCTDIITGTPVSCFSLFYFVRGLLTVYPVILCFAPYFLTLLLIRHDDKSFLSFCFYAVICLAGFFVFTPFCYKLDELYTKSTLPYRQDINQTQDLFRFDSDYIVYYSKVQEGGAVNSLTYQKSNFDDYEDLPQVQYQENTKPYFFSVRPFRDPLVATSIKAPDVLQFVLEKVAVFFDLSRRVLLNGYLRWALFTSFGLSLICVVFLSHFSSWKLINVLIVSIFVALVLVYNYLANCTAAFVSWQHLLIFRLPVIAKIKYPVSFLFNIIFCFLAIVAGVISWKIQAKKALLMEQEATI